MMPPIMKCQVWTFIGLVKYYRYILAIWSHLLQLLTSLTSDRLKFKCMTVEQKVFDDIKGIIEPDTLLEYPYFNEQFDIHTDDSYYQLGVVII